MTVTARMFLALLAILIVSCGCTADNSAPPWSWKAAVVLDLHGGISRVTLPHNSPEAIRKEMLDPTTVRLIATSSGLSERDLKTIRVAQERPSGWVCLYQTGKAEKAFNVLSDRLRGYVQSRSEGHTRGFLLAAITNSTAPASIPDADLKALRANHPLLPATWLRRADSGTITNKAGRVASSTITTKTVNGKEVSSETVHIPKVDEVCRWVSYTVSDGEVGWRYLIKFNADGSVDYVCESRCDAKEYEPKYQKLIKETEREVETAMKRSGEYGQFGSCHTFWRLKKEKLKQKGIAWRSPRELNPNTSYD